MIRCLIVGVPVASPLPVHRPLRRRLSGVQMPQSARLALIAGGEGVLLAGLGIAVVGDDAGVVTLDLFRQVGDQVLRELGFQLQARDIAALRRDHGEPKSSWEGAAIA